MAEIDTIQLARKARRHALRMMHLADASHIGTSLSMADLLAVLYGSTLRVDSDRRRRGLRQPIHKAEAAGRVDHPGAANM